MRSGFSATDSHEERTQLDQMDFDASHTLGRYRPPITMHCVVIVQVYGRCESSLVIPAHFRVPDPVSQLQEESGNSGSSSQCMGLVRNLIYLLRMHAAGNKESAFKSAIHFTAPMKMTYSTSQSVWLPH